MKLQIMSRLQQTKTIPLRSKKESKGEESVCPQPNILSQHYENQASHLNDGYKKTKPTNPIHFFKNFQTKASVHYTSVHYKQSNIRRKLEVKLCQMNTNSKKEKENICNAFTFSQQVKGKQNESKQQSVLKPENNLNDYYFVHQKPKQRVRKFNSLITIRMQPSHQEEQRKPGFILKRNLSMKKDSTNLESNKENVNTINHEGLTRVESKERFERVDQQINQSKERIARIRKELNEIYQSKKGPNTFKLRLY